MFIVIVSILAVSQLIDAHHVPYQPFGTYGPGSPGGNLPTVPMNNQGSNYGNNYLPNMVNYPSNYGNNYPMLPNFPSSDNYYDRPLVQNPNAMPDNYYQSMNRVPVQPAQPTGPRYFLVSRPSSPNYDMYNGGFTGGNEKTYGGLNYGSTGGFCGCYGCPSCVYPATRVCFNTPNGPYQKATGDLTLDRTSDRSGSCCANKCNNFHLPQQRCCQCCEGKAF
ncbi:uncharacterized protein LOC106669543 isoform X1 [Cimex lectularius]|uniref:Uncharacterized protein n=1 Tax=Cimex lectularius TaxID=79782 RepID=A0A8I6TJ92_CIMLE|nr:uncharacterized protein LOC106669543 isoform X1 [Cimex lectularius]